MHRRPLLFRTAVSRSTGIFFRGGFFWTAIDAYIQDVITASRSEEHTSELQSPCNLVCRLLLEKRNPRSRGSVGSESSPGRDLLVTRRAAVPTLINNSESFLFFFLNQGRPPFSSLFPSGPLFR